MSTDIALPALDRYRAIHAARVEQAQREHKAAQQREREAAEAKRAEETRHIVALAEHLLGPALVGWEIVTNEQSWHHRYWSIRRAFGDDVVEICCRCQYEGGMGGKLNRVQFEMGRRSSDFWVNFEQPDHDAAEAAIAMLVVPALDRLRQERERRAEQQAIEAAQRDRRGRAEARLAELVAITEGDLDAVAAELEARYGWLTQASGGPGELHVWKLSWVMGVSSDGDESREEAFSVDPYPNADGFYRILESDGIRLKAIHTPNAIVVDQVVWRGWDDLPYALRQCVQLQRFVKVATEKGSTWSTGPNQYVERRVKLPGATVRGLLGLPTDTVEGVRDEVVEELPDVIVKDDGNVSAEDLPW